MTRVLRVDPEWPDAAALAEAAQVLRQGGLVAFPTETVYGLGVHALDPAAVRRLYAAKQRPSYDPLIVHVSTLDDVQAVAREVPSSARLLAARYWPGPLTLVLPRAKAVPGEVTAGLDTVAVRIPAHRVAAALLDAARIPVAAPSANLFSRPSPTRAEHVLEDLGDRIDLIVDAGATTVGVESTVVDLSTQPPTVLRPGAITLDMLREVLPGTRMRTAAAVGDAPMPSPGLLTRHYAPRVPLRLYEGESASMRSCLLRDADAAVRQGRRVGLLLADEDRDSAERISALHGGAVHARFLGAESDATAVAARLFTALRELDSSGVDIILARQFPGDGLGSAVQDRLRRAAAGDIFHC